MPADRSPSKPPGSLDKPVKVGALRAYGPLRTASRPAGVRPLRPLRPPVRLSPRAREAIAGASRGLSSREIALELGVSARTVDGYFEVARRRLEARNRPHVVALAIEKGLISPREPQPLELLSERQLQTAECVARGLTAPEIAAALWVTESTAHAHILNARRQARCRTSTELAALVASRDLEQGTDQLTGLWDELGALERRRLVVELLREDRADDVVVLLGRLA
jgi:DNA-binding CsgD family transcriptional regulator